MTEPTFRDILTESLRYWERMRVVYNLILGSIVIACFVFFYPNSLPLLTLKGITEIMGMCVIANILFCAAYPIDVVIQYSHFRSKWTWYRLGVFSFGLVFASLLTLQMMTVRFAGVS